MDSGHSAELEQLGITYSVLLDFVHKQRIGTEASKLMRISEEVSPFTRLLQLLLASIAIYIYDILTTFDLEVQFVWKVKPRITFAKVLFVLVRPRNRNHLVSI